MSNVQPINILDHVLATGSEPDQIVTLLGHDLAVRRTWTGEQMSQFLAAHVKFTNDSQTYQVEVASLSKSLDELRFEHEKAADAGDMETVVRVKAQIDEVAERYLKSVDHSSSIVKSFLSAYIRSVSTSTEEDIDAFCHTLMGLSAVEIASVPLAIAKIAGVLDENGNFTTGKTPGSAEQPAGK